MTSNAEQPTPIRLVVGLGNPGREYRDTRHNVGFMIADRIASAAGVSFRKEGKGEVARVGDYWLCKPMSYMNVSGEVVGPMARFYKIAPEEILVVLDDMALPLGKLRIRPTGSAGGHNGLKSILQHLGTQEVPRLRIGIGGVEQGAAIGHVLGQFAPDEKAPLAESLGRAVEAIDFARRNGLPAAMNQFN